MRGEVIRGGSERGSDKGEGVRGEVIRGVSERGSDKGSE